MNHSELWNYALKCSLEHHLSNAHELFSMGKSCRDIMSMLEKTGVMDIVVWEPYENWDSDTLIAYIEDMGVALLTHFMEVREDAR